MKCKYCGYNIGLEDKYCPHCGKLNDQAAQHIADMEHYEADYEQTKETVITKSTKFNGRTGRIAVIALLLMLMAVALNITHKYSDIETREKIKKEKTEKAVEKNRRNINATLKEMEEHREYLAMSYFVTNHRLRGDDNYDEYMRVFTAAISYKSIYEDILNIVDGYEGYEDDGKEQWCNEIAIYITDWNSYVSGEFWDDSPTSPMHSGTHGEFLADCRKDTQDMVQVYFKLTDEEAEAMWTMEQEALSAKLYEKCMELYPEGNADE